MKYKAYHFESCRGDSDSQSFEIEGEDLKSAIWNFFVKENKGDIWRAVMQINYYLNGMIDKGTEWNEVKDFNGVIMFDGEEDYYMFGSGDKFDEYLGKAAFQNESGKWEGDFWAQITA